MFISVKIDSLNEFSKLIPFKLKSEVNVRKDMINKYSLGTFKKAYKKLKNSKYINKKRIKDLDITIYPYDIFYKDMDNLLKKNKKIFILGKN